MEKFFRDITESLYEVMWEVDSEWKFIYLSDEFKGYMNLASEDLIGKTPFEMLLPNEADRLRHILSKLASEKKNIRDVEITLQNESGINEFFLINGVPVLDKELRLTGYRGIIRNITEKARTEAALKESVRKLSVLMGNLPGMAYRCFNDENWTMIFVSGGVYSLTGYKPEELINNNKVTYASIIHPDDRGFVYNEVQKAWESKETFELVYRIICADGSIKWVLEKGGFVLSYRSESGFIEGFITDITERKKAEDAVSDAAKSVSATLDGLSAHIAIIDCKGVILNVNRAWIEFAKANHKGSFNVLTGANYIDVCRKSASGGDKLAQEFLNGLTDVLSGKNKSYELEYPCHSKSDNRWFVARVTEFPAIGPERAIIAHENITSRKKMEIELAASEERNRILVESAPLGIDISRKGKLLFVNRAYLKMFGYDNEDEILSVPLTEQIAPDKRDEVYKIYSDRESGLAVPDELETSGLRKDGTVFPFLVNAVRIVLNDGPAILGFIQDISKRKQSEMELKKFHEHLEKLVEERTEEIRLLNLKVMESQEEERRRISKDLHDSVGQTILAAKFAFQNFRNSLFKNESQFEKGLELIDMSSRELKDVYSGLYPAMLTELGLSSSIHWLIKNYLETAGIEVNYNFRLQYVFSYRFNINIYRIVQEVFNNIIKHSGAKNVEVNVTGDENSAFFKISDNGTGFNVEHIMKQCRGAGLFNIRERVSSMNGRLCVNSGMNSTVIGFEIPLERP